MTMKFPYHKSWHINCFFHLPYILTKSTVCQERDYVGFQPEMKCGSPSKDTTLKNRGADKITPAVTTTQF
jgi:hypothetical protein